MNSNRIKRIFPYEKMAAFRSGNDELVILAVENRLLTGGSFVSVTGEMVDGNFRGKVSTGGTRLVSVLIVGMLRLEC